MTNYVPGRDDPGMYHILKDRALRVSVSMHRDDRAFHIEVDARSESMNLIVSWPHFGWGSEWEHHDEQGKRVD